MRNLIAHLGLVLMGVVMGVLLAGLGTEVTLRVTDAVPEVESPLSGSHQSDAYLGWSGKPNLRLRFRRPEFDALVEHDAEGWRQPKPPRPAVPTSRILVLGDSFTWGWGVSQGQVFTDLLQAALPATVAVYNRSVPGFGTAQEYLLLQRELAARVYDAVVLMFYMNDLSDNISSRQGRRPYFELVDGDLRPRNQPARPVINPVGQFLREHSRAYAFAQFRAGVAEAALLRRGERRTRVPDGASGRLPRRAGLRRHRAPARRDAAPGAPTRSPVLPGLHSAAQRDRARRPVSICPQHPRDGRRHRAPRRHAAARPLTAVPSARQGRGTAHLPHRLALDPGRAPGGRRCTAGVTDLSAAPRCWSKRAARHGPGWRPSVTARARGVIVVLRTWPLGLSPCPRTASEITRLERHR